MARMKPVPDKTLMSRIDVKIYSYHEIRSRNSLFFILRIGKSSGDKMWVTMRGETVKCKMDPSVLIFGPVILCWMKKTVVIFSLVPYSYQYSVKK